MDELKSLVDRARNGDLDAFGIIVGRFQDMALAYAYSVMGDFHLAEDAAQEAFIQAYRDLDALRDPDAFPGWFRKIIFKHCDRIKRKRHFQTVSLESVNEVASGDPDPAALAEAHEMREMVLKAISSLPESERTVTTLFYINGYSQKDVAEFLEVPVSTVNNRLHSSRTRLKERMVQMVNDELKTHALPKDFPERIRKLLELPRPLEIEGHPVRELWQAFRSCFTDFEEVELDEICERKTSMLEPDVEQRVTYVIDEHRMLRPELTSQMVNHWMHNGGGQCKLITVGRVFRAGHTESETILEVHHQAEVLWVAKGLDMKDLDEIIFRTATEVIPGVDVRSGSEELYPFVKEERHYEALWRERWTNIAAGGIAQDEWLIKAGLDPSRFGAISFAFGLDRCALVRMDLDDIRKLWRPPYVN
ncbi:sigma-70 family RNA polymerase sigma factor [bacterium]|nr:sigma-70 family RNA polymerase sigma factor [bacterium]